MQTAPVAPCMSWSERLEERTGRVTVMVLNWPRGMWALSHADRACNLFYTRRDRCTPRAKMCGQLPRSRPASRCDSSEGLDPVCGRMLAQPRRLNRRALDWRQGRRLPLSARATPHRRPRLVEGGVWWAPWDPAMVMQGRPPRAPSAESRPLTPSCPQRTRLRRPRMAQPGAPVDLPPGSAASPSVGRAAGAWARLLFPVADEDSELTMALAEGTTSPSQAPSAPTKLG